MVAFRRLVPTAHRFCDEIFALRRVNPSTQYVLKSFFSSAPIFWLAKQHFHFSHQRQGLEEGHVLLADGRVEPRGHWPAAGAIGKVQVVLLLVGDIRQLLAKLVPQ